MYFNRPDYRYTPNFCEENIWWLAHALKEQGATLDTLEVLFFTNTQRNILMLNQNSAPVGQPTTWDYHVVLRYKNDGQDLILDFDTRLGFVTPLLSYFRLSFPSQKELPETYRAYIRCIPTADYLTYFYSDRKHMTDKVPESEYPDYPIIQPGAGEDHIKLSTYWDINQALTHTKIYSVDQFLSDRLRD